MKNQSENLRNIAQRIACKIKEAGYQVCYAGGCVRDQLLGKIAKDVDIATSAKPEQLLALFPNADTIGAHFGVVLIHEQGVSFEVATFREDGNYLDGRHPQSVCFSTAEKDAQRRDFTINGLFEDPWSHEILDYVGGKADLEGHLVRAIGDPMARFKEDALRLLRAIRFSCVLGFPIEEKTWQAILLCSNRLKYVSVERIWNELEKIFCSGRPAEGLSLLMRSGLMHYIIPEMYDLEGCEQPPQFHPEGDVYTHTKIMLEGLKHYASFALILGVLLHDIGKPSCQFYDETGRIRFNGHAEIGARMAKQILLRLKCSNNLIEKVVAMVKHHMYFINVCEMRKSKLRRFMARETFAEELELHRLDCASSNGDMTTYLFLKEKLKEYENQPLMPEKWVTGAFLIELGFVPGPVFRRVLHRMETLQLEHKFETKEDAYRYLRRAKKKFVRWGNCQSS